MQIETAQKSVYASGRRVPFWLLSANLGRDTRAIASLNRAKRICIKGSFPTPAKISESTRRVVQGGSEMDVMEAWAGKLAEWASNQWCSGERI